MCGYPVGLLAGPANKAIVVQGVEPAVTTGGGGIGGFIASGGGAYTDGRVYFNGELVKCDASSWTGGGVTSLGGPYYAIYMVFTTTLATLGFHSGITQEVVMETRASLQLLVDTTPEDATHVKFSNVLRFGPAFGALNRDPWTNHTTTLLSGAGINGAFRYKNDNLNNTVILQTTTTFNVLYPYSLVAAPADTKVLITGLGTGYLPAHTHYFQGYASVVNSSGNQIQDDSGAGYIRTINCWIDTIGHLYIELPKPAAGCASYTFAFNATVPLDSWVY